MSAFTGPPIPSARASLPCGYGAGKAGASASAGLRLAAGSACQQAPDAVQVDGRVPVLAADVALEDHAVAPDQQRLRKAEGLVAARHALVGVQQQREAEP